MKIGIGHLFYMMVIGIVFGILTTVSMTIHRGPLKAEMPTRIDVNGIQWRVELVDKISADGNTVGRTHCEIHLIMIAAAPVNRPRILMHELSHAAVCTDAAGGFMPGNMFYNSTTSEEHEGIYMFSTMWAEILLRNPQLALYLGGQ